MPYRFGLYEDEKYERVIRQFLLKADKHISAEVMKELADIILSESISEYTLLFEISMEMSVHKRDMQIFIFRDIFLKSADGTYPPYAPYFRYVPEYSLYEELLIALDSMTENKDFTKALALTGDVCSILGRFNEISEITTELDGKGQLLKIVYLWRRLLFLNQFMKLVIEFLRDVRGLKCLPSCTL